MIIDSHCHLDCLDLTDFNGELTLAIQMAKNNDVGHILCVCINLEDFPKIKKIAEYYDDISLSVGLHPNEEPKVSITANELIELANHHKIVAIGETGLDYYRSTGNLEWQQQRFREHIRTAIATVKPLIIHTRAARDDTLTIMREEGADKIGGVMHCFSETWEMAQQALDMGFYISFSGIITFKNAVELQEVVKKVPLEKILIETDAPYLTPVPYRGKPNQPAYVKYVAEKIAELKELSYATVATETTKNFFTCFPLASYISER